MNIGEYSVQNRVISWLLVILLVGGGVAAFPGMGKLEDPAYTIKLAKIITFYPGATAEQVQDEVTYHIEDAVQRLGQLKRIKMSISRPGMSDIEIQFKDKYTSKDFPAIYDELRRKINDMRHLLPPGAMAPIVVDDFADVYGTFFAITGDGYTYRDLKDFADGLKKQLVLVPGVRKVEINGAQPEVVYAEISRARLGELGISFEQIAELLESQNVVSDAGRVDVGSEYIRIHPTGEFTSVKQIGDLLVSSGENQQIYLKDITTIRRAYQEVPDQLIYFNGQPALTLGISMLGGVNVIEVGERMQQRVTELSAQFPAGIELREIYNQPLEVDKSVQGFVVGVGQALAIVIVVLLLFMGLRVGLIIGAVLLITVAGTLWFMSLFGIELQRVSLGALVIALGMLVDNAIVVAEGMLVRMQRGMAAASAARETVGGTIWALLGGTIIGILAFSAIGFSQSDTGEFTRSLFYVILISLLLSWITAISTTPLLCALLLKPGKKGEGEPADPYAAAPFRIYRSLVGFAIQHRWLTVSVTVGLFVISLYGFTQVKQAFFPQANTPLFFIDVWAPEGTDIRKTRDYTLQIEAFVRQLPGVEDTTAVIGSGATRFTLVYEPKENAAAYAQIIVRTGTREQIAAAWTAVEDYMQSALPELDPLIKTLRIGPGRDGKIEARFHGPDPAVLRSLAEQAKSIMRQDPETRDVRDDWRQPAKVIRPVFNEQVGRALGITRHNLAAALQSSFEGTQVGLYRDGIRLLPILLRPPAGEREDVTFLQDIQVYSPVLQRSVTVRAGSEEFRNGVGKLDHAQS